MIEIGVVWYGRHCRARRGMADRGSGKHIYGGGIADMGHDRDWGGRVWSGMVGGVEHVGATWCTIG
jgi:hypothetical protein